jgi:pyrroline-5-carboxylate reductase
MTERDAAPQGAGTRADALGLSGPLLLIGCGKMGGALLRGWLKRGIDPRLVHVVDIDPIGLDDVASAGIAIVKNPDSLPAGLKPAILLLAIKPQFMDEALPAYRRHVGPDTLILSIAAGKTIAYFQRVFGVGARIVRAMPNTPAAIGRGMTVICRAGNLPRDAFDLCGRLMAAVGEVAFVEAEDLLNPVTAVSGGGPAYVFLLIECLAEAGRQSGLPADLAMRLARATVSGAGELARLSPESAAQLRQAVTSPKGTTLEALNVLMAEDGMQGLMIRAIAAATKRSRDLAG